MLTLSVEAHQARSLAIGEASSLGTRRVRPQQRMDIEYTLALSAEPKSFHWTFAQLRPHRPCAGAHEYVDPHVDAFFAHRWPSSVVARGEISVPESEELLSAELRRNLMSFARRLLWEAPVSLTSTWLPDDQLTHVPGYRREFFHTQLFDIQGSRRPSDQQRFVPTELREPVGPGVVTIDLMGDWDAVNELVWSPVLPFSGRSTLRTDWPELARAVNASPLQLNGVSEFADAQRYLGVGDIKGAVRSGASAAEATLKHYAARWQAGTPPKHLPFDDKVEHVLASAGKPSFRQAQPEASRQLLYLYRTRTSMHEGDCYFSDVHGQRQPVRQASQVTPMVDAVRTLLVWADSIV